MRRHVPDSAGESLRLQGFPPLGPAPGGAGYSGGGDGHRRACRFYLTHKELLGTWLENAASFAPGEAVPGIVRGVKEYGVFVELTPNLSGLAEWRGDVSPGDRVSVYIKSIRPDTRKIKLQIIQNLGPVREPDELRYFITDGPVEDWRY